MNFKAHKGFTLIEIVLVLAIAAMVMAGAAGLMLFSSDERVLRSASGQIEVMAKRARAMAILMQTPYALEFRQGIVRMKPLAQAGRSERREGASSSEAEYVLSEDIELFIRRWNSERWLSLGKKDVQVWRFEPSGLCEPLTIKLVKDKSSMEDSFHPLSANIRESQSEIR